MHIDMHIHRHVYRHAYRHVCRHVSRHVCRHVYRHTDIRCVDIWDVRIVMRKLSVDMLMELCMDMNFERYIPCI